MLSVFACTACGALGVGAERHACNGTCSRKLTEASSVAAPLTDSFVDFLGSETALEHLNELYEQSDSAESVVQWTMEGLSSLCGPTSDATSDAHDEHADETVQHDVEEDGHDKEEHGGAIMKVLHASELETASLLASGDIDLSTVVATIMACQLDPNCDLEGQSQDVEVTETEDATQSLKIGLAMAMLAITLVTSYLPVAFRKSRNYEGIMSVLNAMSAAIFLSVAFLHLLPHVLEYEAAVALDTDFPVGFALVQLGFVLILFVENVVFDAHGPPAVGATSAAIRGVSASALSANAEDGNVPQAGARGTVETSSSVKQGLLHVSRTTAMHFRTALITELAVTVHAVLETILLGLMGSRADILLLFAAIMSHKVFASMSIGTRFTRLGCPASRLWVVMLPYHVLPPLADILGSVVESADGVASLVLTCLATGTFLYVGAYELVLEEFGARSHIADHASAPFLAEQPLEAGEKTKWRPSKRTKFAAYCIAVGIIALVTWLLPEPHDH